jgi:hypothetical protein
MTDDLIDRLQTWIGRKPLPYGRTFHPMHEEVLIAEAHNRIVRLESTLLVLRSSIDRAMSGELNVALAPVELPVDEPATKIQRDWLTHRAYRCLMNEEIHTLEQLAEHEARELLRVPNLGKKTLKELKELLAAHGLALLSET